MDLSKCSEQIATNGDAEHWASSKLDMTELERVAIDEKTWAIENYHRGLKQFCGVEKCQARSATAQRNHIAMALRAAFRNL
jgi:IS4 transposase